MRSKLRRIWPAAALVLLALAVLITHFAVDRSTREPPNYTEIEEGLWLGGRVSEPPDGTKAVLNLCESEDPYRAESHRWEPIRDAEPVPTLDWLRDKVAFIDAERRAGRTVYVHCLNGVSRSAMVMAAYLMWRANWPREKALDILRSRRPIVRPNPAFQKLLVEWEQSLKG